ncbi:ubiquinone biosynthesis accessory factor UbiJ [Moraxella osloensis]|uniref:ubiquinone biosynthesis accessory factor UbiJ n=1 Tax=Faucicola osloensis TaxID=34062 RepID=UPI00242F71B8|nr:hypothetical protein [Moraxella osloensis]
MFTVLLLAGIEKVVNLAIATDPITQAGLQPLSGKVLRLMMAEPAIEFDTIFNDDHIRFEPVTVDVFEPKGSAVVSKPDCIVTVDNPAHLLHMMGEPEGNLPIKGDYKVLMQVKQLMAGFDADIIGKLQPIIGVPLASQLHQWLDGIKQVVATPAKQVFADIVEIADWQVKPNGQGYDERDDLKQQLLKLRADIEREQARLDAIKAEQNALIQKDVSLNDS